MRILITILTTILLLCSIAVADFYIGISRPYLLSLGDSITAGSYSTDEFGYRKYLQILQNKSHNFVGQYNKPSSGYGEYDPNHGGVSGETCNQIELRVSTNLAYLPADATPTDNGIVLLMCGTNDSLGDDEGRTNASNSTKNMINMIYAHDPDIEIHVAKLIPNQGGWDGVPTYNDNFLEPMVTTWQAMTSDTLFLIDQYSAFVNDVYGLCAGDYANNCMYDASHPNDTGYNVMAKQWYECLQDKNGQGCN